MSFGKSFSAIVNFATELSEQSPPASHVRVVHVCLVSFTLLTNDEVIMIEHALSRDRADVIGEEQHVQDNKGAEHVGQRQPCHALHSLHNLHGDGVKRTTSLQTTQTTAHEHA